MPTLKTNTENQEQFDLAELTSDDLDMLQVALIELQAKLVAETAFIEDRQRLRNLFHAIDSQLIAVG
jgi:hypothetical protein